MARRRRLRIRTVARGGDPGRLRRGVTGRFLGAAGSRLRTGGSYAFQDTTTGRFISPAQATYHQMGAILSQRFAVRGSTLRTGSALSRTQGAGLRVELDTAAFRAGLARFWQRFGGTLTPLVTAHALDLQRRIQLRTPVRTSRLRNSIHTVPPNSRGDGFAYGDNTGRQFNGALNRGAVMTGPYEAIVGTNVEYALAIEAGHSRQAPHGMFAVSVREKAGALDAEVERRLREAWRRG